MSTDLIHLRIATGFQHGSQWLSAGVEVDAPEADALDWIARGLAVETEEQGVSAPEADPAKPRGKKGAA